MSCFLKDLGRGKKKNMVTHFFCPATVTSSHRHANNVTLEKHQKAISFLINSFIPHSEWQHLHNAVRFQMIWKNIKNHIFRLTSIWNLPVSSKYDNIFWKMNVSFCQLNCKIVFSVYNVFLICLGGYKVF